MLSVLLVEDHQMVREGLRELLKSEPDLKLVGEAGNGREAVSIALAQKPDVVVMDASLPELNGIDACQQICGAVPTTKVLIISMHKDKRLVRHAIVAGAAGFIAKDCNFSELRKAITAVSRGEVYLCSEASTSLVTDYLATLSGEAGDNQTPLSQREREVLQLLAEGHSTNTIATKLHVSAKTIETHRKQIMTKLNLRSIAELTKYAVREGMTSLE